MNKPVHLISAGLVALCCQSVHAQLLFSETFDYTSGQGLVNQVNPGNNTAWVNGSTSELTIGSSELTYPGLQEGAGNDLVYTSAGASSSSYNTYTAVTSGSVYYSFLIDCTTLPTANEYITALNPGTAAPSGSSDALSTYVGAITGGWKIGVRTTGGGSGAMYGTALSLNTTYLVVEQLTLGSSPVANLYVDPLPGGDQPTTATASETTSTAINSVADIGFKVQSTAATGNFDIGNLQIGETWADVTAPSPVPEPNSLALLGGGMLLLQVAWRRIQSRS